MDQILIDEIPQSIRNQIAEDIGILFEGGVDGRKIINFWQKINQLPANERRLLGRLKGPLENALAAADPVLAQDFALTNELWGRYVGIRNTLSPTMADRLIDFGEVAAVAESIIFGHPISGLATVGLTESARQLSREMLTNPRFQNLSSQMIRALNQNKFAVADSIYNKMIKEVDEVSPDIADLMRAEDPVGLFENRGNRFGSTLSVDEFEEIFGQ